MPSPSPFPLPPSTASAASRGAAFVTSPSRAPHHYMHMPQHHQPPPSDDLLGSWPAPPTAGYAASTASPPSSLEAWPGSSSSSASTSPRLGTSPTTPNVPAPSSSFAWDAMPAADPSHATKSSPFDWFDDDDVDANGEDPFWSHPRSPASASGSARSPGLPPRAERANTGGDEDIMKLFDELSTSAPPASPSSASASARPRNASKASSSGAGAGQGSDSDTDSPRATLGDRARPAAPADKVAAAAAMGAAGPILAQRLSFDELKLASRAAHDFSAITRDEAALDRWLNTPVQPDKPLLLKLDRDTIRHTYDFRTGADHIVLTAQRRMDGLKAVMFARNIVLCAPYGGRRLAKLRSDTSGADFSLFDMGENPSHSPSSRNIRRELAAFRFSSVGGVFHRRNTTVFLPADGVAKRPKRAADSLAALATFNDPSVKVLLGTLPSFKAPRLPNVIDFNGFAKDDSTKNILLHDPASPSDAVLILGKRDRTNFNLAVLSTLTPLQAMALAAASLDTHWTPSTA